MLIYEYRVRDEFLRVREYAKNVRDKFELELAPADLLLDAKSLRAQYERLNEMLPRGSPRKEQPQPPYWIHGVLP
jgi:hypothetical protein